MDVSRTTRLEGCLARTTGRIDFVAAGAGGGAAGVEPEYRDAPVQGSANDDAAGAGADTGAGAGAEAGARYLEAPDHNIIQYHGEP